MYVVFHSDVIQYNTIPLENKLHQVFFCLLARGRQAGRQASIHWRRSQRATSTGTCTAKINEENKLTVRAACYIQTHTTYIMHAPSNKELHYGIVL